MMFPFIVIVIEKYACGCMAIEFVKSKKVKLWNFYILHCHFAFFLMMFDLTFHSRHRDSAHKIFLQEEEHDDDWEKNDDRRCHLMWQICLIHRAEVCDADFHGSHVRSIRDDELPEKIFPASHERKDRKRCECRFRERKDDAGEYR